MAAATPTCNVQRIAYLNSEYPSLSHSFIEREVRTLRGLGVGIDTFSVRRAGGTGVVGEANRAAAAETFVLNQWGRLARAGVRSILARPLALARAIVSGQRLSPPGIARRMRHAGHVLQACVLTDELHRRGIRHVHVHMANNGASIALLAARLDPSLSYSLSIHGSAEFFHVDDWRLGPKAEGAAFVRCISEFCRAQVMAWTRPASWAGFRVVRCGIDTERFSPRPPRHPGPLRLLTVGRLHPIKGYDVLLRACALLRDRGVEFEVTMVGDGPLRGPLESMAAGLGLADRVLFAGPVPQEEVGPRYDRADAMVVSSFMEGVPIVLMEAMSKELGVVATRVGGIPELVEDGVSGHLVDPGSAESLAAGIARYAQDVEACGRHGAVGRRTVTSRYQTLINGEQMRALFLEFLGPGIAERSDP